MKLCEDVKLFDRYISIVADSLKVGESLIEKDYYVTQLLLELTKRLPNILFKGGTSLSKCYKIIDRFSEDIDLTLDANSVTQSQKRKVKYALIEACNYLGYEILNIEETRSRRDYNNYDIQYPIKYYSDEIKPIINAETVYIQKAYPNEIKQVTSLIYDYLILSGNGQYAEKYEDLHPFFIRVQTLDRTLIDKVFAICDYKISNNIRRNSRHIYDLSRLLECVKLDESLKELAKNVRKDRKANARCFSAQDGIEIPKILAEIIDSKIFKDDYENVTKEMMYKYLSYDEAIKALNIIIDSGVFDN